MANIYYLCHKFQSMKDIICIGHITHDRVITPEKTVDMAGGTAFYFANALNCLPRNVSFGVLTKVGDDAMKEVRRMRKRGIAIEALKSRHTVCFENRYEANQNHRTQRVTATADPFSEADVLGLEARVFHLGTLLQNDFPLSVARLLKEQGKLSVDLQGYLRRVEGELVVASEWAERDVVLRLCDIVKLNEYEMKTISGSTDARRAARLLSSYGIGEVIITLGSEGSLILKDGIYYDIPAYKPTQLVDATGCGDTYSAGYLYFRTLGATPLEAGKMAAAMCTKKLECSGPFASSLGDVSNIVG